MAGVSVPPIEIAKSALLRYLMRVSPLADADSGHRRLNKQRAYCSGANAHISLGLSPLSSRSRVNDAVELVLGAASVLSPRLRCDCRTHARTFSFPCFVFRLFAYVSHLPEHGVMLVGAGIERGRSSKVVSHFGSRGTVLMKGLSRDSVDCDIAV